MRSERTAAIASVATLDDPQRRRLYEAVRSAHRPLTREEAAREVEISRKLAAFHLDKLVASGLLELVVLPVAARRGVGRTPKRYQPSGRPVGVTIPPRSYDTLASVLLQTALETDNEGSAQVRARVAADHGRVLGASAAERSVADPAVADAGTDEQTGLDRVQGLLAEQGFEPYRTERDSVRLHNCPFHPFAARATAFVCGVNLNYLEGVIEGLGVGSVSAVLAPCPGECCVEICAVS